MAAGICSSAGEQLVDKMATSTSTFTLLGVGDDVELARAELLADLLTRVLPAFRYRKVVVRKEKWQGEHC